MTKFYLGRIMADIMAKAKKAKRRRSSNSTAFTVYYYNPMTHVRSAPVGHAASLSAARALVKRSFRQTLGPTGPDRIQIVDRRGTVVAAFAVSGERL